MTTKTNEELWEEYRISKLPYTTHFGSICFLAACEIKDKEITELKKKVDALLRGYTDDQQ